jgi:hypothetical protein
VDRTFSKARAAHGQERILVNCAGTGNAIKTVSRSRDGSNKQYPIDEFNRILQINLVGTFRCIVKSAAGMLTLDTSEHGDRGDDECVRRGEECAGGEVPFPRRFGHPSEFASLVLEMCRNTYFNGEGTRSKLDANTLPSRDHRHPPMV